MDNKYENNQYGYTENEESKIKLQIIVHCVEQQSLQFALTAVDVFQ